MLKVVQRSSNMLKVVQRSSNMLKVVQRSSKMLKEAQRSSKILSLPTAVYAIVYVKPFIQSYKVAYSKLAEIDENKKCLLFVKLAKNDHFYSSKHQLSTCRKSGFTGVGRKPKRIKSIFSRGRGCIWGTKRI
jgi:hypothetical protein